MRRFNLWRDVDATGVSGTGNVAEGVEFSDGQLVVRWKSGVPSTVIWDDGTEEMMSIHGHNGWTTLEWVDAA